MAGVRREDRLKIANHALLAEQLDYLLEEYGPTQTELETTTGFQQEHFSKLRNEKTKSVTPSTYNTLLRLLPAHRRKRLVMAFELGTRATHDRYRLWLARSLHRIRKGTGRRWERNAETLQSRIEKGWRGRAGGREGELRTAIETLDKQLGGQIRQFRREHLKRGHSEARVTLAIYRTIGPLIETSDAAFVERHLYEMSKSEVAMFIKSGLRREELLLKRTPDIIRIQEVARLERNGFTKAFGLENMRWPQPRLSQLIAHRN